MEQVRDIEQYPMGASEPIGIWLGVQEGDNFHRVALAYSGEVTIHENMNGKYSEYSRKGIKTYSLDTVPDKWVPWVQQLQSQI